MNFTNFTYAGELPMAIITVQITVTVGAILSLMSVIANSYILIIIYYNKDMRSSTHYGLCNLAIANLVVAVFYIIPPICILWTYNSESHHSKSLTSVLCGFLLPLSLVAVIAGNITLAIISVENYRYLKRTLIFGRRQNRCKAISIFLIPWIIGILQQWPRSILVIDGSSILTICTYFTKVTLIRTVMLIFATLNIFIPFSVTFISHFIIAKKLKLHERSKNSVLPFQNYVTTSTAMWSCIAVRRRLQLTIALIRELAFLQLFCCLLWLLTFYISAIGYTLNWNKYLIGYSFCIQYAALITTGLQSPILYIVRLSKFQYPLQHYWSACRRCGSLSTSKISVTLMA
ncbi:hypothetical protein TrispH2_008856 [Trichoplax sp. H2]|nr:hypothetical protein TrispH2_008856 [Trichoplax sp. H2]|eukprot:RDD40000.1 hypothetical protein TrispH2_008856 [Trichoplax sp. H2]